MKKTLLTMLFGSLFVVPVAWADEASDPHVFDDLNGDGVSDARIPDGSGGASSQPSQETEDEDQTPMSYGDSSSG